MDFVVEVMYSRLASSEAEGGAPMRSGTFCFAVLLAATAALAQEGTTDTRSLSESVAECGRTLKEKQSSCPSYPDEREQKECEGRADWAYKRCLDKLLGWGPIDSHPIETTVVPKENLPACAQACANDFEEAERVCAVYPWVEDRKSCLERVGNRYVGCLKSKCEGTELYRRKGFWELGTGRMFPFLGGAKGTWSIDPVFLQPSGRVYFDLGEDEEDEVDIFEDGALEPTLSFVGFDVHAIHESVEFDSGFNFSVGIGSPGGGSDAAVFLMEGSFFVGMYPYLRIHVGGVQGISASESIEGSRDDGAVFVGITTPTIAGNAIVRAFTGK